MTMLYPGVPRVDAAQAAVAAQPSAVAVGRCVGGGVSAPCAGCTDAGRVWFLPCGGGCGCAAGR
jgi:hypothetical protein